MKKTKRNIAFAWIVLICFAAGQWVVYAHQHSRAGIAFSLKNSQHKTTVTEKCQLCDAMHHNSMLKSSHQYFSPITVTDHFYTPGKYDFVSIALILSAGRSPPLS